MIITLMFVCIVYAGGMPLLYPLCLFFLTVMYWYTKHQLIKFCSKHQPFNEHLIIKSYGLLKWAFVIHFFLTWEMLKKADMLNELQLDNGHFELQQAKSVPASYPEYLAYLIVAILGKAIGQRSHRRSAK